MLKKSFVVGVASLLLLVGTANAMIGLGQSYGIGAFNGGGIDGIGVAIGGTVVNVDNGQTATDIGCGGIQVGLQKQSGILVQGGTAIGTNPGSDAAYVQAAGAESSQCLLVTNGPVMGNQQTGLCLGQAVLADDGGAAQAGQGAILGNAQFGGNSNTLIGNASVVGGVNTATALSGPCSDAAAGNAVTVETNQSSLAM